MGEMDGDKRGGAPPSAHVELARRAAMLDALGYAATRIVGSGDWRAGIADLLDRLGAATGVSRVSLFEVHSGRDGRLVESCRYDWAEPPLERLTGDPRYTEMPLVDERGELDEWTARRRSGEVVQALLRDLTGYNRQVFLEQGTLSFISVPIMLRDGCRGFLGFDDCKCERVWSGLEIDVLRTAAALIAGAMERAADEERLRLSEERYALAARGANDGLWDWDLASGRAYFSPRLCEIVGVPEGTLGERMEALFERFEPHDAAAARSYLKGRFTRQGRKFRFECRLLGSRPQSQRWVAARGMAVYAEGRPIRLVGSLRDISEFKQTLAELRASESRVHAILDTAFDAIITTDAEGRIVDFNAAAARIFGHARQAVVGRALHETIVPPKFRASHLAGFRRYVAGGARRVLGQVTELEGLRADGASVPIELSVTEVPLPSGRLFTAILRDLTDRKRFERQLAETEKQRASLARHFSPNMVDEILEAGSGVGETRELAATVLFADLMDFTALSAAMPGAQVIALLREFHALVEEAVFGNSGTLDKYMGDGLMATFGTPRPAPRDATNAVACARRLIGGLNVWNRRRAAAGEPPVLVGIGLHFGAVTLGNVGSERRLELTVVGDTVNLASRIEAMSRPLQTAILASHSVIEAVRREGGEELLAGFRDLGSHEVRGRRELVRLWGLTALAIGQHERGPAALRAGAS
jgi:PAS domain S-box-containing protein